MVYSGQNKQNIRRDFDQASKTPKQKRETKHDLGVIKLILLYDFCFG